MAGFATASLSQRNQLRKAQVATVKGNGVAVLALQPSVRAGGSKRCFFCSTADNAVSVFSVTGEACTLMHQVHLPTRVVALESLPGRVVCGLANTGDISILCEVCSDYTTALADLWSAVFLPQLVCSVLS